MTGVGGWGTIWGAGLEGGKGSSNRGLCHPV